GGLRNWIKHRPRKQQVSGLISWTFIPPTTTGPLTQSVGGGRRAQQLIPQAKLPADELQGMAAAPPGQVMSQVEACVQVT
ncbi:MAG: hypothetical protein ABI560_02710, partial [Myxococcales bacterium]